MKTFIVILIACLIQLQNVDAKVDIYKRLFPSKARRTSKLDYFYNEKYFMVDGRLTYVICESRATGRRIRIEQLLAPYTNATYSCEFNLTQPAIFPHVNAVFDTIGKDKVLIINPIWNANISIYTAHLNKCRLSKEVKVEDLQIEHRIYSLINQVGLEQLVTTYNDSFDIFFYDTKRCGNKECRLTIDDEGNVISGPTGYMNFENDKNFIYKINSISDYLPGKGFVYITSKQGEDTHVSLIQPNGTEKLLAQYSRNVLVDTNNDLISVFYYIKDYLEIGFTQFDELGNIRLQSNLTRPRVSRIYPRYLYNLPEGGLLWFVTESKDLRSRPTGAIYIMKINEAGEVIGKFHIQGLDLTDEKKDIHTPYMHIWKDEVSKKYCASVAAKYDHLKIHKVSTDFIVNCFDDTDFTN